MQKIKLTIFSRLVIGYFVIFVLTIAISAYNIVQLHQIKKETDSILLIANRFINLEENLTSVFQTMVQHEKQYISTGDEGLYRKFLLSKESFENFINGMLKIANTPREKGLFLKVKGNLKSYEELFNEEAEYIRRGQKHSRERYERAKEDHITGIMETLKIISSLSQHNYFSKIRELDTVEINAIKLAVGVSSAALVFLVIISIFITLSISRPLSVIEKKTEEIARGDFGHDLNLSSPPEVAELAKAFNIMTAKLKELDSMKSDFFASMSHELRTPLTSIKEGANLLKESLDERELRDKDKKLLSIIFEESDRLIQLVNRLMDSSKIDAGMMRYDFSPTDIALLVDTAVREIGPLAETNRINIETKIEEGLPEVSADHERILQVLRNLIANALKFTKKNGSITVSAGTVDEGVKVSVSDTGIGIPEDSLKSIFEKYQQGISSGSGMIKGVGLGLSISKHIIKAHGGRIRADSKPGEGSTFSFILSA